MPVPVVETRAFAEEKHNCKTRRCRCCAAQVPAAGAHCCPACIPHGGHGQPAPHCPGQGSWAPGGHFERLAGGLLFHHTAAELGARRQAVHVRHGHAPLRQAARARARRGPAQQYSTAARKENGSVRSDWPIGLASISIDLVSAETRMSRYIIHLYELD